MAGIPTVSLTREGFEGVVANAFAGLGFPAEAPMAVYPTDMFVADSDLTPLHEHIDRIVYALCEWQPETTSTGIFNPANIIVKGADYPTALRNVNNLFIRNSWRDSLPVEAPTVERVDWILRGTDMDADEVIGKVPPRGGIATVRSVATALAMAGGRPEYLPYAIAATQAMTDPRAGMQSWNSTTCSVFPAFIVNGPNSKDIRLGAGYGMLGGDPAHPAGQILGRAIRLIQLAQGGATPGVGTMSIFGACRTTNAFFAEDDQNVPPSWTSLAEDRGYTKDQNIVTITPISSMTNVLWDCSQNAEINEQSLYAMAGCMKAPNWNRLGFETFITKDNMDLAAGISVFPAKMAKTLVEINGMSKADVKQYLWEHTKIPFEEILAWGGRFMMERYNLYQDEHNNGNDKYGPGDLVPCTPVPEQIVLVLGGGDQAGHGFWMQPACFGYNTSVEVKLPKNWDELMLDAEIDMGPAPVTV